MDFTAEGIKVPCYIGKTKFKAGIFLSRQIAGRKKYAEHLKLMKFENYEQAKEAFLQAHGKVTGENIRLNCLYDVRDKEIYSVFLTPYHVGIFETELKGMFKKLPFPENGQGAVWQDYLTYEQAVKIVREHFSRVWHNSRLYITNGIPLNTVIAVKDIYDKIKNHLV